MYGYPEFHVSSLNLGVCTNPHADKGKDHMFQRTESLPLELPQEGTLRPRRPKLQRSQSEIVNPTRPATTSPSGPPDITAIDLTHEHIHKAYSQADLRPPSSTRMPPLDQMTGFGKYRRSIHADPEWQMQQYRANLRDIPGLVPQLGDFKLADPDPAVWDRFCQENARSNSFTSSKTSHSNSSDGPADGTTGSRNGPVVTRGFVPSTTSSAASSFRESSSGHTRRDSALSMTSPSGESENKLIRFPSRQSTLSLLGEPTTLTAINEDLAGDRPQGCKVSQFLECDTEGNVEDAVDSDYENEPDDDATQIEGTRAGIYSTVPLAFRLREVGQTQLIEKGTIERMKRQTSNQHKRRENKTGLDRSITVIRKPVKPALRRTMSRGKAPGSKRGFASENSIVSGKKTNITGPKPQEHISSALVSSDESAEAQKRLDGLGLYMATPKRSTIYPPEEKEDPSGSFTSHSTTQILNTEIVSNLPMKCTKHSRRNRSNTAIRNGGEAALL